MGCCGNKNQGRHEDQERHGGTAQTTILKIEGMTCGHCKASVEKALNGVKGVTDARVDLARKEAVIEGSPSREDLVRAVEDAGYRVVS